MEKFPVYPYAFIQVPAVAKKSGVDVICKDIQGIPSMSWRQTIQALIEKHDPMMILITLRNTDSLVAQDYVPNGTNPYFPIERTKELISAIREISSLKIILGGFGFSLLPNDLMHYLRPDLGVLGGPDGFFTHLEEIKSGNCDKVPNLMYFKEDRLISTPRELYSPLADSEYTPQAIRAMMEFYETFPTPGFQGAPVEIMRGCSHSCLFCAEPISVGPKVRYRDPDAVMKDIKILADNGITKIYMISSELNPVGNEYILQLADRICSFNKTQPENGKVTWYGANYLLTFSEEDYRRLYRSGFTGGWFDVTGLDDKNARSMHTPYRIERLRENLRIYAETTRRQNDLRREQEGSKTQDQAGDGREDDSVRWTMFLGNPGTTLEAIRNTLQAAHREGLSDLFDDCSIIKATRVFDYERLTETALASTYSVTSELKRTKYQQMLPSFAYPPALLEDFSEEEISGMFDYFAETYLSKKYQRTRDWHGFIQQNTTAESVNQWMMELSKIKGVRIPLRSEVSDIQTLFLEKEHSITANEMAQNAVDLFVSTSLMAFPYFFESLGLPGTPEILALFSPYELATIVFNRWKLDQGLPEQNWSIFSLWKRDLLQFCIRAILYRFNVQTDPTYREFFIQQVNS
jgi:hypothetical protein